MARDYGFVVWMDSSLRFLHNQTAATIHKAKKLGVMSANGANRYSVATVTAKSLFSFLNEDVSFFIPKTVLQAGFLIFYPSKHSTDYFMKPWVSCALTLGCMMPDMNPSKYLSVLPNVQVHACHRFDQSVSSILLHRLFGECIGNHVLRVESGMFVFFRLS